jgi:hypothetical protein
MSSSYVKFNICMLPRCRFYDSHTKRSITKRPITKCPITNGPIAKCPSHQTAQITKRPITKYPITKCPISRNVPVTKRPRSRNNPSLNVSSLNVPYHEMSQSPNDLDWQKNVQYIFIINWENPRQIISRICRDNNDIITYILHCLVIFINNFRL